MKWPAERIANASKKSFGMFEQALALEAEGHDLIHLEVGRPEADTPAFIKAASKAALDRGIVHYGDFRGTAHFRATLAEKLRSFNAIDVEPDEILVTNGLTHASFAAILAGIDPGDEVIFLEPYYPQHIGKVELAGGKVVTAPLDRDNGFAIRRDLIEARITPRTRMIVLVNPSNPTGRVHGREELQALADLAIAHDLIVLSDEVYEHNTFDGRTHVSIASLPGMKERTISCFAFTKAYCMDGWRIGYLAADKRLVPAMLNVVMNDVTHVNVFVQEGAAAAVREGGAWLEEMVAADRAKRDLVVRRLNQMPNIRCPEPEGTIYAFPDISRTGFASAELAERLLAETHVVTEAGSFYGPAGEGHLRICFGSETEARLAEAMDRLTEFFNR